jgi:tRNA(adenine34) deaminase
MAEIDDKFFMACALNEARWAARLGEVPVGACLVLPEKGIVAAASNMPITLCDPTAHAEILVLRKAAKQLGNYRLGGLTLYCTLEPCVMCAGALVNARIERLVYGAADERFGAVETQFRICDNPKLNHRMEITAGVLAEECRRLMQDFFRQRRQTAR